MSAPAPSAVVRPAVAEDGLEERFLRVRDVAALVGLGHSQIYALVQEGRFPAPLVLGPKYTRWLASEVRAWMRDRLQQARRLAQRRAS